MAYSAPLNHLMGCGLAEGIRRKLSMAKIISIDWSVEEFRRLIGEQPHSSDTGIPLDRTVRVLDFEVNPPSGTTNHAHPLENANSPDV
jgi:hypothetical protein